MGTTWILYVTLVTLLCYNLIFVICNENSNDVQDSFVPTHEWKVVKKGQKIPKGLHVRVNLETGITEAKLLDESEVSTDTNAVSHVPDAQNSNTESAGNLKFSQAELKEALKNIKNDDASEEYIDKITNAFRSYEELKKDLAHFNINPKTDGEILKELLMYHKDTIKSTENEDLILTILEDLEYLVHQIDNANDFVTLNGFVDVIYPNLNSSSLQIKSSTLKLLGSCVQNNAKVQIHALETGAVGTLLKVLVLNSDYKIKNRAIFALSGLMRRFPLAQLKFVDNAGLNVFAELLEKSNNIKIQLKIVTLVNDLILEHKYAREEITNVYYLENLNQYNAINLRQKLDNHNWCHYVTNLLTNIATVDINDHDSMEKTLNALIISNICDAENNNKVRKIISQLQMHYANLIHADDDDYYKHLLDLCNQILKPNYNLKSEL